MSVVTPFIYYGVIPILLLATAAGASPPSSNKGGGKRVESWGDSDSWSIVRPSTSEPRVSLEQELDRRLAVTVEVDFLLANADKAALAKVAIFPYGRCGVDSPVLDGSGIFCHTDEQEKCVEGPDSGEDNDGPVLYTATYRFQHLNATAPGSAGSSLLWNPETDTLAFCGRLFLALEDDLIVSFHDINFEYSIDLRAEFTVTNALQAPPSTETFSERFSPAVETCLCDQSNICLSASDIPATPVGGEVRICIQSPADEDFEILEITEWKLEQDNTGLVRYAIQDGLLDGLTTMHSMAPHEIVVSTALDSQFFQKPENGVTLSGFVSVQPHQTAHIRRREREVKLYSNEPAEERASTEFSISLELLLDSSAKERHGVVSHTNVYQVMPSDGIILLVVSLFALLSLLVVVVVRHRYGPRVDRRHVLNTGAQYQDHKEGRPLLL